jgi:hypothetical protein
MAAIGKEVKAHGRLRVRRNVKEGSIASSLPRQTFLALDLFHTNHADNRGKVFFSDQLQCGNDSLLCPSG